MRQFDFDRMRVILPVLWTSEAPLSWSHLYLCILVGQRPCWRPADVLTDGHPQHPHCDRANRQDIWRLRIHRSADQADYCAWSDLWTIWHRGSQLLGTQSSAQFERYWHSDKRREQSKRRDNTSFAKRSRFVTTLETWRVALRLCLRPVSVLHMYLHGGLSTPRSFGGKTNDCYRHNLL